MLQLNVSIFDFWELTLREMILIIEAYNEKITAEQKRKASEIYTLADLIGVSVARLLDDKMSYPPIYQVFPELFAEEAKKVRDNQKTPAWMLMKERMVDFAEARNKLTSIKEGE